MSERKGDWIQTFTGRQFWPLDPRPEEVCIEDVAHSLSNQCRYSGHVERFYSVAEHSYRASLIVPPEDAMWALLHDASEAYLVDLPRPLKRHSEMGALYKQIESGLMRVVCQHFGLPEMEPRSVSIADNVMICTERRDLMKLPPKARAETEEPLPERIVPWDPPRAEGVFLVRFVQLGGIYCPLAGDAA
jgi:hypothetical protein